MMIKLAANETVKQSKKMEGPHPTVPSVKMARYISSYNFQFKFNLKIEKTVNLKKKT